MQKKPDSPKKPPNRRSISGKEKNAPMIDAKNTPITKKPEKTMIKPKSEKPGEKSNTNAPGKKSSVNYTSSMCSENEASSDYEVSSKNKNSTPQISNQNVENLPNTYLIKFEEYQQIFMLQMKLQQEQLNIQQKKYDIELKCHYKAGLNQESYEKNSQFLRELELEEQKIIEQRNANQKFIDNYQNMSKEESF